MIEKEKQQTTINIVCHSVCSTVDDDDERRKDRLKKRLIKLLASHFFSQFILDQP
jgi:hypothetical protein